MSNIYTKTGDHGDTTGTLNNRVSKSSCNIQFLGDLDELNCHLSVCISMLEGCSGLKEKLKPFTNALLQDIQHTIFEIGRCVYSGQDIEDDIVLNLEPFIDSYDQELKRLKNFIYPDGGNPVSIHLFICRAITRRTERSGWLHYEEIGGEYENIMRFLNRLSDLLFVLARTYSTDEVIWVSQYSGTSQP